MHKHAVVLLTADTQKRYPPEGGYRLCARLESYLWAVTRRVIVATMPSRNLRIAS